MAKTRKINNALIRVFDQSSSIVYFVADDLKISYANQACSEWVGVELETLVGTNLVFTSEPLEDSTENAAKGLAIAPHVMSAVNVDSMSLQISSNADKEPKVRSAQASPIHDHRGVLSGFLVVGSTGIERPDQPNVRDCLDSPAAMHDALALVRKNFEGRFNSKRLVGTSAAADRVRRQVQSAADSEGDVLIVGPQGSGREHVARTIFASSIQPTEDKLAAPLLPLHCSITDPVQIQGTMKELLNPDHGRATLLLIDVDQMDARSQQELLGYLQLPVTNARLIATSSTRLIESTSGFDQTLASRLSTLTVELPPLSERREDLPLLAQAILESRNDQVARQFSGFTRQANEMICEYDWPGNFGQLSAAIDEAAANASGPVIQVADFSEDFQHSIKAQRFAFKQQTEIQLDEYLQEIEEQLINRAITESKGNKTKAAELLGISRAKLLRRLAAFEQTKPDDQVDLLDPSVFEEATDE